jgi:capsule polysaccharide export protein KpsE/RkpR
LGQNLQNATDRKSSLETQLQGQLSTLDYYKNNSEDTITEKQSASQAVQNQQLINANNQLQLMNEQLAGMQQIYGAKNPEVISLKARIKSAQQTKDMLEKEQQQKEASAPLTQAPSTTKVPNKNAQVAIVNLQNQIDQTKTQITEATGNIKLLQSEQEAIARRIAMYEQRIEQAPLNERQWAELQRDHLLAQQEYDDKMKKRQSAETAQNLEEHKAGETLELLDPPSDPQQPTEPKRATWAAMGTGIGLLAGVILAGAKEMKNTSLKNLKDVRAYTNLPVLSSIPLLENALLVRRKRRLFWLAWSSAFILGSMAVLASVYYYYVGQK